MSWTKEKPTKPGWYWWRHELESGFSTEVIQVHLMVWNEADQEVRPWCSWGWISNLDGEWQGPITPTAESGT